MAEPMSAWWCCLRPQERQTLSLLAPMWFINPTYVHHDVYLGIIAVTGEASSIKMLEHFEQQYGLEHQLIPCGEDCFIDAEVFLGDFWPQLYAFSLTDPFICTAKCKLLTFPL